MARLSANRYEIFAALFSLILSGIFCEIRTLFIRRAGRPPCSCLRRKLGVCERASWKPLCLINHGAGHDYMGRNCGQLARTNLKIANCIRRPRWTGGVGFTIRCIQLPSASLSYVLIRRLGSLAKAAGSSRPEASTKVYIRRRS